MIKITGIYKIINLVNDKIYIGQAKNIKSRWRNHRNNLNTGRHKNEHLQAAWNKYDKSNFVFHIKEECSIEELNDRETYWILEYDSMNRDKGYNKCLPGKYDYSNIKNKNKDRRGSTPYIRNRSLVSINLKTGEYINHSSCREVLEFIGMKTYKLTQVLRYWKSDGKSGKKTYKGFVVLDSYIFHEIGLEKIMSISSSVQRDYSKTVYKEKPNSDRLRQSRKKDPSDIIPMSERNLKRTAVVIENAETGEQFEFRSIVEGARALNLDQKKLSKILKSPFRKYSHRGYFLKYKKIGPE